METLGFDFKVFLPNVIAVTLGSSGTTSAMPGVDRIDHGLISNFKERSGSLEECAKCVCQCGFIVLDYRKYRISCNALNIIYHSIYHRKC